MFFDRQQQSRPGSQASRPQLLQSALLQQVQTLLCFSKFKRTLNALVAQVLTLGTLSLGTLTFSACEPPPVSMPGSFPQSSAMGISANGRTLYLAMSDHDEVRIVDASTGQVRGTVPVPGYPHRLTVLSDGRVAVSARYAGTVSIIDPSSQRVDSVVEVGSDPFSLIEANGFVVVALAGQAELARISLNAPYQVADRVALNAPDPRGLVLAKDGTIFVSHFSSGTLSTVDLGVADGEVDLHLPSMQYFAPNQVEQLTLSPSGDEIAIPHVECNNDPAQFASGGTGLTGASNEYYVEGPTGYPAVVPAISRVDVRTRMEVSDGPPTDAPYAGTETEHAGPVPALINPLNTALLGKTLVNRPTAVALADGGRLEIVVSHSSGNVLLRPTTLNEGDRSIIASVNISTTLPGVTPEAGSAPGAAAIVLSPDGGTAYVYNAFTYEVVAFQVPHLGADVVTGAASAFSSPRQDYTAFFDTKRVAEIKPIFTAKVGPDVLSDDVAQGRLLFHAIDPRLTRGGVISCASCHPGGAADHMTWAFEEGPRQTPPLWGGLSGTEPFHWNQDVRDMADVSRATIETRMGGTGLPARQMAQIEAYLDTIPAPAPPMNVDAASADRGATLFFTEATGCVSCHSGPDFTDNQVHNVSTGVGFGSAQERAVIFGTPPLKGLAASGPYLHDGSAATLHDLVEKTVLTDKMGNGSQLSNDDVDDLVAFLMTL